MAIGHQWSGSLHHHLPMYISQALDTMVKEHLAPYHLIIQFSMNPVQRILQTASYEDREDTVSKDYHPGIIMVTCYIMVQMINGRVQNQVSVKKNFQ